MILLIFYLVAAAALTCGATLDSEPGNEKSLLAMVLHCSQSWSASQESLCPEACRLWPEYCYYAVAAELGVPGTCKLPPYPRVGSYNIENIARADAALADFSLFYSCPQDYILLGEQPHCRGGVWTAAFPSCQSETKCKLKKYPSVTYKCIDYASGNCPEWVGSAHLVQPVCHPNYEQKQLGLMRCVDGNWNFFPKCQPRGKEPATVPATAPPPPTSEKQATVPATNATVPVVSHNVTLDYSNRAKNTTTTNFEQEKDMNEAEMNTNSPNHNSEFYNSTFISNLTYFNEHWANITKPKLEVHAVLSNSHRRATTLNLSFPFPFYGQPLHKITVATGGFMYTGEHVHNWLSVTQYIAPLMANFDTSLTSYSFVKMRDDGEKFTVLWENVNLREDKKKYFTFAATLYANGDVIFAYKDIPVPVQMISDKEHQVKVGVSDAYLIDRNINYVRRKTINEYHRVTYKSLNITSKTLIRIVALPTCLQYDTCESCANHETQFHCSWCEAIKKCSSGTDRNRQNWVTSSCDEDKIVNATQCPATTEQPPSKVSSTTDSTDSSTDTYATDTEPSRHVSVTTEPGDHGLHEDYSDSGSGSHHRSTTTLLHKARDSRRGNEA